jgi:vancomycin resistance protein YoaR
MVRYRTYKGNRRWQQGFRRDRPVSEIPASSSDVVGDRVHAKTTRALWSATRSRPGVRLSRRLAARPPNRVDQAQTAQTGGEATAATPRTRVPRTGAQTRPLPIGRRGFYVILAFVLALGFFSIGRLSVRGEVYPGVGISGVPLGGLTAIEARQRLGTRTAALEQTRVTLSYDGHTSTRSLAELGLTFDLDASVRGAIGYGRRDHVVSSLLRPLGVAAGPVEVPPAIRFDRPTFEQTLLDFAREIDLAPVDAAITFDAAAPRLTEGRDGRVFDASSAQRELLGQIETATAPTLTLTALPQSPAVRAADLAPLVPNLAQALTEPLIFADGDRRWSLAVADLAGLIRITPPHDGQPATATLDPAAVRALGERLAGDIDRGSVEASIDQSGDVPRLIAASPGKTVRIDDFVAAVQSAFATGQHEVAIPIDQTTPTSTTETFLTGLGITDRLATGTSDFAGSEPGRATNVVVAAKLVDGVMIPPHGTFSFNHAIGEINATPGFVPAGASENGIAGTAVGGGVCQVTTTVFRAALKAGLPITEWWPHAYRNIYYEQGGWAPGFDASVQQPDDDPFNGSDFVFANPTDHWLLVRADITDETKLSVELYGAPTGYRVEIGDPIDTDEVSAAGSPSQESVDPTLPAGTVDLVQPARDGMTTTVVRHVYDASGSEISTDSFVSNYEPQGPSYRVSPDMADTTAAGQ